MDATDSTDSTGSYTSLGRTSGRLRVEATACEGRTVTDIRYTETATQKPARFWRQFVTLCALGMVGVVSLIPLILAQVEASPDTFAAVPTWAAVLVSLVQPAVLLLVAVAVGVSLAPRVGLTSLTAERIRDGRKVWPRLGPDVPLAVGLGFAVAVAIVAVDAVTAPLAGIDVPEEPLSWFPRLVLGMLYGGVTEELLLRWGLMTALVWAGHRVFGRKRARPSAVVVWASILVTAVVFGLAHLPAMSMYAELTPFLVTRTVVLNALGGVVFGWLYWRRGLEVAVVAHASVHVAFAVLRPLIESFS